MNETHQGLLINKTVKKPLRAVITQLISTSRIFFSKDTQHKTLWFAIPPICDFPPGSYNLEDMVKTFSPDKSSQLGIFIHINTDRLIESFGHLNPPFPENISNYSRTYVLMSRECCHSGAVLIKHVAKSKMPSLGISKKETGRIKTYADD
jgi:hypothetical protein